MTDARGTQGYTDQSADLLTRYDQVAFADVHGAVMHLFPDPSATVLDIGSGSGRDACYFANLGHKVRAIEPISKFRTGSSRLHPSPLINWVDDSLPELKHTKATGDRYDLILLSAVWMHLDADERMRVMPVVASLLHQSGLMIISLRHGLVPAGRRMFEVTGAETINIASAAGLKVVINVERESAQDGNREHGVTWTCLAFRKEI